MLWPRIFVPESGFNLAASGAVGKNAYDEEEVALELANSLKGPYPQLLAARYRLDDVDAIPSMHDDTLLTEIGRKRGAVISGGRVNMQKAAEVLINDFRSSVMGRITLETPAQFEAWCAAAKAAEAEKQAKKLARQRAAKRGTRDALPDDETDAED